MSADWTSYLPAFVRKRLEGRHELQKVMSNTGWLFADKVVRMGVGLLVNVWVARYLGPEQFGTFSYALAFFSLFAAVAGLGLDGIVVRNLVRDPAARNEVLGTSFLLKLLGGTGALVLSVAVVIVVRPSDPLVWWLVGITAAASLFQAFDAVDYWFQSQVASKYVVLARNGAFLFAAGVKVALIYRQAPLVAFAWASTAEAAVAALGLVTAYRYGGGGIRSWRASRACAKRLLRDSWPLIFSGIVIMVYMRIDQVMLGEMIGDAEVGVYSVAVRLAEVWYMVPGALISSTFPSVVEAREISEDLFLQRLQKLYNMITLMSYAVALPTTFLAGWVVEVIFGAAYRGAGPMLAVLIWTMLFTSLGMARSSFLTVMNWTRLHFVTVSLGCIVNVALNFVLIPRYGGMGAVIASLVAYWFAAHGVCFLCPPLRPTGWMLTRAMFVPRVWR